MILEGDHTLSTRHPLVIVTDFGEDHAVDLLGECVALGDDFHAVPGFLPKVCDDLFFLFDLPGYGFAKAPKDKVDTWTTLVKDYLRGRPTLKRVFLLIDSRHGIKPVDLEIMEMLDISAVSYQAVLTKIDKIKVPKLNAVLKATTETFSKHPAAYPDVLAVSSVKNEGLSELRGTMARVLEIEFSE